MSVNTCLINRCLSSASAIIRSWFIYELQKSTTVVFSRNSLYSFYSRNRTCETPYAFGFPIVNTPHSFRIPVQRTPLPFGNPKSRLWYRYEYFLELPIVQTSRSRGQHLCSKFAKISHLGCQQTFKVPTSSHGPPHRA